MFSFTLKSVRSTNSSIILNSTQTIFKQLSRYSSQYFHIDDELFGLTSDERQLRSTIFNLAQKEIAPYASETDREDNFKNFNDLWKKLGSLGMLGITVNEKYGGMGGNYLQQIIIAEEIARASAAIASAYSVQSSMVGNQISMWGTEHQKSKYLPQICTGEIVGATAISETTAGSDVGSMKTTAKRDGDHYVINGTKSWISNGPIADLVLVYVKTKPNAGINGLSAFLVEKQYEGFSSGPKQDKFGVRGFHNSELIFEDVRVPAENLLGKENKAKEILLKGLNVERLVLSGAVIGVMQAACDVSFDYVHHKEQFGQKIGLFQLMQSRLADMYVGLCSSRSYVYNVARKCSKTDVDPRESAAAYLLATENGIRVCQQATLCLGGNGYMNDYPVGRFLRDVKSYEVGGGTCDMRRLTIGKSINYQYLKK